MLTPEKRKGIKFEIWMEVLLKQTGHYQVKRDVRYYRGRSHRQVDLEYFKWITLDGPFTILELKYSSNGVIGLSFRSQTQRKKAKQRLKRITDLVEEIEERRRYVGADNAILATNQDFTEEVYEKAEKYGIKVYNKEVLETLDQKRRPWHRFGKIGTIEDQINKINLKKHSQKPHYVRL